MLTGGTGKHVPVGLYLNEPHTKLECDFSCRTSAECTSKWIEVKREMFDMRRNCRMTATDPVRLCLNKLKDKDGNEQDSMF